MDEIYPVQGKDLPDPPEPWHWKKAVSALATVLIGVSVLGYDL